MLISNHEQLLLFMRCLGLGVWLQIVWETDAVIWYSLKKRKFLCMVKDFVLSLICGLTVFLFALAASGGELRAVMMVAVAIGAWVCHITFGRLIHRVAHCIRRLFAHIHDIWCRCLRKGRDICKKTLKKVVFFYKKGLRCGHIRVYNRNNK